MDGMKLIKLNGITNQSFIIHATITRFICDAPARAFLKCIKCHSGFSSCERSNIHGDFAVGWFSQKLI